MNYIINPMWIYLVSVSGSLREIAINSEAVCSIALIIFIGGYAFYMMDAVVEEDMPKCKAFYFRTIKHFFAAIIVFAIAILFVPKEETLYKMMLAKLATYENAETLLDAIQRGADYIISALKVN